MSKPKSLTLYLNMYVLYQALYIGSILRKTNGRLSFYLQAYNSSSEIVLAQVKPLISQPRF